MCMHDAHGNKLVCFSVANLSFLGLIYRAPARKAKMGRGKLFIPLPYSANQSHKTSFWHFGFYHLVQPIFTKHCVPYPVLVLGEQNPDPFAKSCKLEESDNQVIFPKNICLSLVEGLTMPLIGRFCAIQLHLSLQLNHQMVPFMLQLQDS